MFLRCIKCNNNVDDNYNICPFCHTPIPKKTCPQCGVVCPGSAIFCQECGYLFTQNEKVTATGFNPQNVGQMGSDGQFNNWQNSNGPFRNGPINTGQNGNGPNNNGQFNNAKVKGKHNILPKVLIILLILLIGGGLFVFYIYNRNLKIDSFKEYVDDFKTMPSRYSMEVYMDDYDDFVDRAEDAIDTKDVDETISLKGKMKLFEEKVKNNSEETDSFAKSLEDMDSRFEVYILNDSNKEKLEKYKSDLKDAVENADTDKCKKIITDLDDFEVKAESESRDLIDEIKQKVDDMDIDYLDGNVWEDFMALKQKADDYSDEENYSLAKEKYDECLEYQDKIDSAKNGEEEEKDKKDKSDDDNQDYYNENEFVFYDSDSRFISESEAESLSDDELYIAINEIYARRGYKFQDEYWKEYFESKSWYEGKYTDQNEVALKFNEYEKENKDILAKIREQRESKSKSKLGEGIKNTN